jgi:hypothetical protein
MADFWTPTRFIGSTGPCFTPTVAPRAGLQVVIERDRGRKPLVAHWGGISLAHKTMIGNLDDNPKQVWNSARREILTRLLADTCELCGSTTVSKYTTSDTSKICTSRGEPKSPNGSGAWPPCAAKP